MSNIRLAHRYARPLLGLAEEAGVLEEVHRDMVNFSGICKESREFVLMLKSPIIPHLRKAQILKMIFGSRVENLTATALDIITRKNREAFLPDIAEEFILLYNKKKGFQEVTLTTPIRIDEDMRQAFIKIIKDITGKEPMLNEQVDPELIGGYVLRMGDQQLDESISGQLKDLELKFKNESI